MAQENENIQNQSTGPNLFSRLRKWAVRLSIVGLLATNLATLVNATVYDFLYSAIESASQLFGADEFMSSSSTSDNKRKLSAEKKKLKAAKYSLSSSQNELRNSRQKLTAKKNELKNISDKFNEVSKGIKTRLGKSVLLNIEVIPASIAPFISTAAVLGALSGEVFLACETEKELNSLRALVGLKKDETFICGMEIPTVADLKKTPEAADEATGRLGKTFLKNMDEGRRKILIALCRFWGKCR